MHKKLKTSYDVCGFPKFWLYIYPNKEIEVMKKGIFNIFIAFLITRFAQTKIGAILVFIIIMLFPIWLMLGMPGIE
jgi:hypothetical protein